VVNSSQTAHGGCLGRGQNCQKRWARSLEGRPKEWGGHAKKERETATSVSGDLAGAAARIGIIIKTDFREFDSTRSKVRQVTLKSETWGCLGKEGSREGLRESRIEGVGVTRGGEAERKFTRTVPSSGKA